MADASGRSTQRPRITIVGAGHCLMPKDRIGPRVMELLAGRYGPEVELKNLGTTALGVLDHLDAQDLMIVVDACLSGREAGDIVEMEPDLETPPSRNTSVHQIGPVETLIVAKHLYPERLPRQLRLVLVETDGIDPETEERACREVVALLDERISEVLVPADSATSSDPSNQRSHPEAPPNP